MKSDIELTPEIIALVEKATGVKVIDAENDIIEYEGKQWKTLRSQSEYLCACFDNEPLLCIGETQWVDVNWKI